VRERTRRAVRAEQRNAHRLVGALLDSLRARIVVEACLGEARGDGVDLDPLRLQLDRHRVESRLGRRVDGAEDRAVGAGRVRVHGSRANAARHLDDAGCRRLSQEGQYRLVNGEDAEHVGLPHRPHFIEGRVARAGRLSVLRHGHAARQFTRIRDSHVVDQHVEAA
jgi:hypothetical protein